MAFLATIEACNLRQILVGLALVTAAFGTVSFGLVVGLPGLRVPLLLGNATRLAAKTRPMLPWFLLPGLRWSVWLCLSLLCICLTLDANAVADSSTILANLSS